MKFLKKYLEKREMKKETRRKEKFLNTKIPISELYLCRLCIIDEGYEGKRWTSFKHQRNQLLKKVDKEDYIDVTTNTKYKGASSYDVRSGDIVVCQCCIPYFQRKFIEQQYMTISDIIEMNESLKI